MKVESIDYRELQGQNPLFLDYLHHYDRVDQFYCSPVHLSLNHLKNRAEAVLERPPSYPRELLVQLLTSFNQKIGAPEPVFRNIEKLRSTKTVVVVTGHQLGFFGGPCFLVYKTLTAVRLAQLLQDEGFSVVPVFWLASDDSDFEEVRSASFFDPSGELFSVECPEPEKNGSRMVGTVSLKSVEGCLNALKEQGLRGQFYEQALETLSQTYKAEGSFREALAAWLHRLFPSQGLVIFDPLMAQYKAPLQQVLTAVIEERSAIVRALQKRSLILEKNQFSPQVQVGESESFIFWSEDRDRYKLEYEGGYYTSRKKPKWKFSAEDMLRRLRSEPEHCCPNVLLRPILQDHVFPTVTYVGGPSEVAYYSQVNAISSFWNAEMEVFPRMGVTIVDRKSQRLLEKYGLQVSDVLNRSPQELASKVMSQTEAGDLLDGFAELEKDLLSRLKSLEIDLTKIDPTTAQLLEGVQSKIFYQLRKVQQRFVSNHRIRKADFGRHLDHLCGRLAPGGKFQERTVNFNQFLSEEGPVLVESLLNVLNPFCLGHQVVYL